MIDTFARGAGYAFAGLRWLPHPRLRRFVLIPLLVNIVLFAGATWWGAVEFDALMDTLLEPLPGWLDWLRWLLWPVFALALALVVYFGFTVVANLIASPFKGLLAERVEALAAPGRPSAPEGALWKDVLLAPLGELRKLGYFLLRALPLLALFLIPGLNLAAPLLWAAFSAWMLALQYADYPMGNGGLGFRAQRRILAGRRMLALGFGAGVLLLILVPVLNFVAIPTAVIGATLMWVKEFQGRAA